MGVLNLAAGATLALLYPALGDAGYWSHVLRSGFGQEASEFHAYHLAVFGALLGVLGLPVALSGATLPLLFHALRRELGGLGELAGRLYSGNTIGSLLGALVGGYALLFWLDLHSVYRVSVAAVALAAGLATGRIGFGRWPAAAGRIGFGRWPAAAGRIGFGRWPAAAGLAASLALLLALPAWPPERLSAGLFRNRTAFPETPQGPTAFFAALAGISVPFYDDDPTASVAVREQRMQDGRMNRAIATNGKSEGSLIGDYLTMGLAGLLPALLAEDPSRAFVIGWGIGVTAGELAALDAVREVVVAEISPAVLRAAPFFDEGNQHASQSPKLRTLRSDAYRALLRAPGRFGVIVSEPSNPWVTGVEMLYSREFLDAARDRLAPGGVYVQWFHTYETDAETVALALRTALDVFDQVAVWYATGIDLLVLDFDSAENAPDIARLEERAARPDFRAGLARCGIDSLPELVAHELLPLGVLHASGLEGPVHTLLHPRLSHAAARAFFAGGQGMLPNTASLEPARIDARNSLVARLAARRGGLSEADLAALARETCEHRSRECIAWLALWKHAAPASRERRALLRELQGRPELRRERAQLGALARLHASTPLGGDPWASANDTVAAFAIFTHHAAPFPRSALEEAWSQCQEAPAYRERCEESRASWEALLGNFTRRDPSDGDGPGDAP
jgi:spermidine synthase